MLLAEYHIPAGMTMEPPAEVVRLHRLRQAFMQVEVLPDGVWHVRWWYTGGSGGGSGGQSYIGEPATSAARGLPVNGGNDPGRAHVTLPHEGAPTTYTNRLRSLTISELDTRTEGLRTVWVVSSDSTGYGDDWTVDAVYASREAALASVPADSRFPYHVQELPLRTEPEAS
jgi:hypothetical protein